MMSQYPVAIPGMITLRVHEEWSQTIADLVDRETIIMQKLNEQQMADSLKSDSPDYFTLWESRN